MIQNLNTRLFSNRAQNEGLVCNKVSVKEIPKNVHGDLNRDKNIVCFYIIDIRFADNRQKVEREQKVYSGVQLLSLEFR